MTVGAVVAAAPAFRVVSVTLKTVPVKPSAGGSPTAVTCRSALSTSRVPVDTAQLLFSLLSGTAAVSSAQAPR